MNTLKRWFGLFLSDDAKRGREFLHLMKRIVQVYGPGLELIIERKAARWIHRYLKETGQPGLDMAHGTWHLKALGVDVLLRLPEESSVKSLSQLARGSVFA